MKQIFGLIIRNVTSNLIAAPMEGERERFATRLLSGVCPYRASVSITAPSAKENKTENKI